MSVSLFRFAFQCNIPPPNTTLTHVGGAACAEDVTKVTATKQTTKSTKCSSEGRRAILDGSEMFYQILDLTLLVSAGRKLL